ncbi:FO synthase subunit 1, partial [Durusdinium trenchii]
NFRYRRIREAVENGSASAPVDLRYIKRNLNKEPESHAECVTFLEGIYNSVAETLPEQRDLGPDPGTSLGPPKDDEGYEEDPSFMKALLPPAAALASAKPVKRKGPRRFKKGLKVNHDHQKEERFLPPGRMKDYHQMMLVQYPEEYAKKPSFATFYRDFVPLINDFLQESSFPFEPYRRGFLAAAVPVFVGGISGPGAPHWFEFQRRENLSGLHHWPCSTSYYVVSRHENRIDNVTNSPKQDSVKRTFGPTKVRTRWLVWTTASGFERLRTPRMSS